MSSEKPLVPLNTFVVRFWREIGAKRTCWRGRVQHIQSGEWTAFIDEEGLLVFLRRWVQMPEEGDEQLISKTEEVHDEV